MSLSIEAEGLQPEVAKSRSVTTLHDVIGYNSMKKIEDFHSIDKDGKMC